MDSLLNFDFQAVNGEGYTTYQYYTLKQHEDYLTSLFLSPTLDIYSVPSIL